MNKKIPMLVLGSLLLAGCSVHTTSIQDAGEKADDDWRHDVHEGRRIHDDQTQQWAGACDSASAGDHLQQRSASQRRAEKEAENNTMKSPRPTRTPRRS